jgi:monoamine oxidase
VLSASRFHYPWRFGGRTLGDRLSNGVPVEMGGQWVGPTQDAVLRLIAELGLETFQSYDDGDAITVFDGSVVPYSDESFGLPDEVAAEVGRLWEEIEALASIATLERPWDTNGASRLDSQTLDSWLIANTSDQVALRFFRLLIPARRLLPDSLFTTVFATFR